MTIQWNFPFGLEHLLGRTACPVRPITQEIRLSMGRSSYVYSLKLEPVSLQSLYLVKVTSSLGQIHKLFYFFGIFTDSILEPRSISLFCDFRKLPKFSAQLHFVFCVRVIWNQHTLPSSANASSLYNALLMSSPSRLHISHCEMHLLLWRLFFRSKARTKLRKKCENEIQLTKIRKTTTK